MQTFDVFLKKRLTEIDVIINQLVQRDSFSIYDWLYILCSMDDIQIAKKLDVISEMLIDSDIDNLLELVHETIENELDIDASADMVECAFDEFDSAMMLLVNQVNMTLLDFISSSSDLTISIDELDYYTARSIGGVEYDLELILGELDTHKTAMEIFYPEMELDIESEFLSYKNEAGGDWNMYLSLPPVGIFYQLVIGGKADMFIGAEKLLDYVLKYVLHNLNSNLCVDAEAIDVFRLKKFLDIDSIMISHMEIDDTLITHVGSESKTIIDCEASVGLKRYRLLGEMDDHVLADFDNMSLEEVDYVILID